MNEPEKSMVRQLVELVGDQQELIDLLLKFLPPDKPAKEISRATRRITIKLKAIQIVMALLAGQSPADPPPDEASVKARWGG